MSRPPVVDCARCLARGAGVVRFPLYAGGATAMVCPTCAAHRTILQVDGALDELRDLQEREDWRTLVLRVFLHGGAEGVPEALTCALRRVRTDVAADPDLLPGGAS